MRDLTRGHFDSNLIGCVRNVVVMGESVDPTMNKGDHVVSGMNVHDCSDDEPEEEEADVR